MYKENKVMITQFTGVNFAAWSFRLKSILKENGVLGAITDKKFWNQEINSEKEARAQAILVASVADSHLEYIRYADSAYSMYENLINNFEKKTVRSKLFLRRQLSDLKFRENQSLTEFLVRVEEIMGQLKDAGSELSEEEKVNIILLAMPKSYETVVTALETMENYSMNFVKNRLLAEEEKRKSNGNYERDTSVHNAFVCYTCGMTGHKMFQCKMGRGQYQKRGMYQGRGQHHGRGLYQGRGQYQGRAVYQGLGAHQGQTSYQARGTYQGRGAQGRGSYQIRGAYIGRGGINGQGDYGGNSEVGFLCQNNNVANNFENSYKNENNIVWYIDSGCSDHLINTKEMFSNYIELKEPKNIAAAKNNVTMKALGVGNIKVKCFVGKRFTNCTIKNVYYVPELRKNLLSVSKMTNNGLRVSFHNGKVRVYNFDQLLMIGNSAGPLYSIEMQLRKFECNYVSNNEDEVQLWHRRFGHLGMSNINILCKNNLVNGLDKLKTIKLENTLCEPCLLGKMMRQPFNRKGYRATRPLELVHTDVCGPITPISREGYKYFVTFVDDYTHFVMIYLLNNKSEVLEKFKKYYSFVTKHFNTNLLKLRSDNGKEYVSGEFQRFCSEQGIQMQFTVPYNPEMNGMAERMNRTIVEKARTVLLDSGLGKEFWGDAVLYSAYVTNRSPTVGKDRTPSELWEGRKPDVSNMRIFGCVAYNHVPKQFRSKFDNTGKKMIMIGYNVVGYRLYDPERNETVSARNVVFDERFKINNNNKGYLPLINHEINEFKGEADIQGENQELNEREVITEKEQEEQWMTPVRNTGEQEVEHTDRTPIKETVRDIQESDRNNRDKRTRRRVKRPVWHDDYEMDFTESNDEALCALLATGQYEYEVPSNFDDLDQREDRNDWKKAVSEELKILEESETWKIVPEPEGIKLLDSKWVFTKKNVGEKEICKARLVVRGFQQKDNLEDIYSPVLKLQTLRVLLSVAAQRNYNISQMDVKGAFLYGRIDEDVYLKTPQGLDVPKAYVLKLTKSLYGLKKSPKYWYEKFNETIIEYGFKRSVNDYCLYCKGDIYLLLYVDDLLILGNNLKEIENLKSFLSNKFRMKDMGDNNLTYLGISITKQSGKIFINQTKYLKNLLRKYGMDECKGCDTPMDVNFKMDENSVVDLSYEYKCRSLLGSLMYAMVGSRPDLATAVGYLCRFQSKPSENLWKALKRLLRYVKATVYYSLVYCKQSSDSLLPLVGFADADWARDHDRKSTSGYLFLLFGNTIVWRSRKQSTVALSTTESELISLCEASVEACWLLKLLTDLKIKIQNVTIFEDNQSTMKTVKNPEQKKLKHLDIKYNFIKEKVEEGLIKVEYVQTNNQLADILTKPLDKNKFRKIVLLLGLNEH